MISHGAFVAKINVVPKLNPNTRTYGRNWNHVYLRQELLLGRFGQRPLVSEYCDTELAVTVIPDIPGFLAVTRNSGVL